VTCKDVKRFNRGAPRKKPEYTEKAEGSEKTGPRGIERLSNLGRSEQRP